MKSKWMLLSIGTLGLLAPGSTAVRATDSRPAVVTGLTGTLHVVQNAPCSNTIQRTTPVTGGRIELTPAEGIPVSGGRRFSLTRADISFAGFTASGSCLGFSRSRQYDAIDVQLTRAVTFTATATSTPGLFNVTIPKEQFMISYVALLGDELETGTKFAKEDVTATLDLTTGAVQMHVVLGTRVTFKAGCTLFGCVIDETHSGTLTSDISGTITYPDSDADGVPDRSDNCRLTANSDQSPVATPTIAAPADATLASCLSRSFGTAIAADICDGGAVALSNNAPDPFPLGPTVVTWTAQDAVSRSATDTQTVTVVDTTDPTFTFVPLNISLNDCGSPNLGLATAVDDCAGVPTVSNNAPPKFFVGTTVVTWTATDVSGNDATATQSVTVVDTVAPVVSCAATNPPGSSYRVSAVDSCTSAPVIRLGTFVLAEGETVMINETGKAGVRLIGVAGPDRIRHFQVGKGEGVITATDESANVGTAICR
jgi:hypothetical protein